MLTYNLQSKGLNYEYDYKNYHITINLHTDELVIAISDSLSRQTMNSLIFPSEPNFTFVGLNVAHTQKNHFEASAIAQHANGQFKDFIYNFQIN